MNIKNTAIIFGITVSLGISNLNFGVGCGGQSKQRTTCPSGGLFFGRCTPQDVFSRDNGIVDDVGASEYSTTNRECTCYDKNGNDKGYVKIRGSNYYSCTKQSDVDFAGTKGWYKVPVWSDNQLVNLGDTKYSAGGQSSRPLVKLNASVDTGQKDKSGKSYSECTGRLKDPDSDCICMKDHGWCWMSCGNKCSRGCNGYVVNDPVCLKEWLNNGY